MTSPIVIKQPGFGEQIQQGLAPLIAALQQRQQFGLQRQKLELERQRTEAMTAEAGVDIAKKKKELEEQELDINARDFAVSTLIDVMSMPGGLDSPENLAKARQKIIETGDKKWAPRAMLAFDKLVKEHEDLLKQRADRLTAEIQAQVEQATIDEQIATAELGPELVKAQIEQAQASTEERLASAAVDRLKAENDPTRVDQSVRAWQNSPGSTYGEFRKMWHIASVKGGIPDDAVASGVGDPLAGLKEKEKEARGFATLMIGADATINALTRDRMVVDDKGNRRFVKGARVEFGTALEMAARSKGTFGAALSAAINTTVLDEVQQQILNAGFNFAVMFKFATSGQQSSDAETLTFMKMTLEQKGDSDETIRQKRAFRQMQIELIQERAGPGRKNPVEALDFMIDDMKAQGMRPDFIKAMERERELAITAQKRRAAGIADQLPVQGLDSTATQAWSDSVLTATTEVIP